MGIEPTTTRPRKGGALPLSYERHKLAPSAGFEPTFPPVGGVLPLDDFGGGDAQRASIAFHRLDGKIGGPRRRIFTGGPSSVLKNTPGRLDAKVVQIPPLQRARAGNTVASRRIPTR